MSAYSDLLKTPGVARIIGAQLTARFPFGMLSLAFLLHVEQQTGSYGAAGLVLAATSIGQAIAGPLTSRLMGVWGMRPVISVDDRRLRRRRHGRSRSLPLTVPGTWRVGFVAGLSMPPIQPAVRTIYPKMVNSRQLTPLFSLDASAQEIIWVVGPVITTFVATQIGTVVGHPRSPSSSWSAAALWFIASPELGRVRIPRSKRALRRRAARGRRCCSPRSSASCSSARARRSRPASSPSSATAAPRPASCSRSSSLGSLVGGLALRPRRRSARGRSPAACSSSSSARAALGAACGIELLVARGPLFIAGIGIAPALAVMFAIVSASVKFSDTAEAYGWVGTGQLIGAALGSALAGFLIDAQRPRRGVLGRRGRSPSSASSSRCSASAGTPTCAAATPAPSPTPSPCRVQPS